MSITLENISKSYDQGTLPVIRGLSYTFPDSGSVSIVGRSGVGKSTLLHLMGGLDSVSSGRIFWGGRCISDLPSEERALFRKGMIGYVFQFHHLLPELTALENVALPLRICGEDAETSTTSAYRLLERVGLAARSTHRPSELSGGEQSRVALARALITKPKIILADEPTGALDIATGSMVQSLLFELQQELQALLVVVTHQKEVAVQAKIQLELTAAGLVPVNGVHV